MKALVIGYGYVGKALALELARQGHEVTGIRRSGAGDAELSRAGVKLLAASLTELESLARLPSDYEWVVNCAASSIGGVEDYRRTYLEGTRKILSWLRDKPVRKYVYTSSTGVYGQDDGSEVLEECATAPASETGQVLAQAEQVLLDAFRGQGFPSIVLRVAGIYGPGRAYWLKQFVSGEAKVEGDGSRILNMIHRDDVVGAIIAALEKGKPGEIYNVCDDEPVAQRKLFEWLAMTLRMPMPPPGGISTRRREVSNKRIVNRKLHDDLGYRLKFPTFREGYPAVLKSLLVHPGN